MEINNKYKCTTTISLSREVESVIRGLVCVDTAKLKCNSKYKYTISRYLAEMKKEFSNDELVWEIMCILHKHSVMGGWDYSKGSLSTYVVMRLYYIILNDYNHRIKLPQVMLASEYIEELCDEFIDPDDKLYESELFDCIRNYIGAEVFDLKLEGMKQHEIAKKLGKTAHALRVYMYRKRQGLLDHIQSKGFSIEDVSDAILERLEKN